MRVCCALLLVAILVPCAAGAQTTAADGIQALARGDYATAVRILRPLAEQAAEPDPLAMFFMASLYQSGRGVPRDWIRACGLYLKAATPPNPLQRQSLTLAQMIYRDLTFIRNQCLAASKYPWGAPPPTSFTLGPRHSVRIDRDAFVVSYNDTQKASGVLSGGGWVFTLVRHTALDVSRPTAMRRHFIEYFFWMPNPDPDQVEWGLRWGVFEIVGTEAIMIPADGRLAEVSAAQPPTATPVEHLAHLRVNDNGEAEWVVFGSASRSGVIPPPVSR